jgi:GAF domain-containing protein
MIKEEAYKWSIKQIRSKIKHHVDIYATLANSAAILKERFPNFFWVGFYFFKQDHLLLGPFQGPPACVKLSLDKGVCAAAANQKKPILVPNVHDFPGHVACDGRSNSEIVVPVFDSNQNLTAVLDVDSTELNDFNEIDQHFLTEIAALLAGIF